MEAEAGAEAGRSRGGSGAEARPEMETYANAEGESDASWR